MADSTLVTLMPTTFRADLEVLVSRWTGQPPPPQLRPVYVELTNVALHYGARYWLQDIRHRAFNDPETTSWLLSTYFLDMARQLGGRLHVAYLANPTLLDAIINTSDFVPADAYHGSPFTIAFFNAEGAAYEWLAQERRQDQARQVSRGGAA